MEIDSLIDAVKKDLNRDGAYDRYPIRFLSIKYEDETANNIIKLQMNLENVDIYDIKDLLSHEDAWITPDRLCNAVHNLETNKSFIVVGFSEYARFLSEVDFITIINNLLLLENPADVQKRRIYIPCFALYSQVKKIVKQYHKRLDSYNPLINETDIEDLPRIYFINSDLDIDIKSNEIVSSLEWFGLWRNSEITTNKPIICSSKALSFFYSQASPDNIYNIQQIKTYQDALKYMYFIDNLRPYEKEKDEFFRQLLSIVKSKRNVALSRIILNRLNAQTINEKNIYILWKYADTFDRWLVQNYILLNTTSDSYIYQVMFSLDDLSISSLVEAIYKQIFEGRSIEHVEERQRIINTIFKNESDISFTDRMVSYYKKYVIGIVRKKTSIALDDLDFTNDSEVLADKKDVLKEAFVEELYPYLTPYSAYERRLIIWLYRLGAVEDSLLNKMYPQLSYYLTGFEGDAEPEDFNFKFSEYFDIYRKCRLAKYDSAKYDENIGKWNSNENEFFTWYLNTKIEYPEMYIKKNNINEQIYVIDGVGAEFFGYIVKLLETRGVLVEKKAFTKAHIPSITSVAKEYYSFNNEWITDYDEKVIHGGTYYHTDNIEKSLRIIENIIDKIVLNAGDEPFVITSDHGASVGHKLSKREKKYSFEKAEHDGRCYYNKENQLFPSSVDYAVYDSETGMQWIIALNQQSLYNSSKYSVHGGGTPEEVVIPVIYARKGKTIDHSFNVKAINLKVSGLQKGVEVKVTPKPSASEIKLLAKDGTNTIMSFDESTNTWKANLKRGIEQEITIVISGKEFKFRTIPTTKMGDDLFDD